MLKHTPTTFEMYLVITDVGGATFYGTVTPDPATSLSSVLTVTISGLPAFMPNGATINMSYILSSPAAVVLYLDGDAFPAIPGVLPS